MTKNACKSIQLSPNLFLVEVDRGKSLPTKEIVPISTHWLVVLDCSGSMSYDLPKLREHLKEKIARLLGEDDLLSLVWFSGKREVGAIMECQQVPGLKDLEATKKLIDRWLKPVGLTGFVDPLRLCKTLIQKQLSKSAGKTYRTGLVFMSDGMDNENQRADIWSAVESLKGDLDAATVVQYGYYADKATLCEMAARLSGQVVFAEDFVSYEPIFESAVKSKDMVPTTPVKLPSAALKNLAFSMSNDNIHVYDVNNGMCNVRGDGSVFYLSEKVVGEMAWSKEPVGRSLDGLYGALSVFAERMDGIIVDQILRALADVAFIKDAASLFGKQRYAAFTENAKRAAFNDMARFIEGRDPSFMPKEDALTVLDVLALLQEDPAARLLLDHQSFRYSKISRGREDKSGTGLVFEADKQPNGYPALDLVWNSQRANLSMLIKKTGHVNLDGLLPASSAPDGVPMKFPTHIFRNFAIVADGLVNIDALPIRCSGSTAAKMREEGVRMAPLKDDEDGWLVQLKGMPVLNKKNIADTRAADLGTLAYRLQEARAGQKVWKEYKDRLDQKRSVAFDEKYGAVASDWLKSVGITSYGGYAPPKTAQAEATDFYMSKVVSVAIKGYMTLPPVKDIEKAIIDAKPLKGVAAMMEAHVRRFQAITADADKVATATLMAEQYIAETRALLRSLARHVFALIVSQRGFSDVAFDGSSLAFDLATLTGNKKLPSVPVTIEMKEEKVEL